MEPEVWTALVTFILGAPAAAYGFIEGIGKLNEWRDDLWSRRTPRQKFGEPPEFYVKTTHIKYMMREDWTELTKFRTLRALLDVKTIEIDQCPSTYERDPGAHQHVAVRPDFFSMPGVALKSGQHFLIQLAEDQVFKAKTEGSYILSYEIPEPLSRIHPNEEQEGINIRRPLGVGKLTAEIHFPPGRALVKNRGEPRLEVYEVRDSQRQLVARDRYEIPDTEPIESLPGTPTERFRLVFLRPPRDADIEIVWYWKKKGS